VTGVDGVLLILLGAPVAAEPTLLGGLALFMVLPIEAAPPEVAVPFVAGVVVVVVVVPGVAAPLSLLGVVAPLLVTPLLAFEPSIAADVTGVAVLCVVVVVTAPWEPAAPAEPTELVPPTEPELVVEPVEPALPALEPVLTATEEGFPCAPALLVVVVLLLPLQATRPNDNRAAAKTTVVFLTMS
jgi:hypothetical protein